MQHSLADSSDAGNINVQLCLADILDAVTAPAGFVRILCKAGTDCILGATVVAADAGNIISEISLAIETNTGLSAIAAVIHPYAAHHCSVVTALLSLLYCHCSVELLFCHCSVVSALLSLLCCFCSVLTALSLLLKTWQLSLPWPSSPIVACALS